MLGELTQGQGATKSSCMSLVYCPVSGWVEVIDTSVFPALHNRRARQRAAFFPEVVKYFLVLIQKPGILLPPCFVPAGQALLYASWLMRILGKRPLIRAKKKHRFELKRANSDRIRNDCLFNLARVRGDLGQLSFRMLRASA